VPAHIYIQPKRLLFLVGQGKSKISLLNECNLKNHMDLSIVIKIREIYSIQVGDDENLMHFISPVREHVFFC